MPCQLLTRGATQWYHFIRGPTVSQILELAMTNKHQKILDSIFKKPVPSNVKWKDIENLFISLGAEITEGNGSRVRVALNGIRTVFHRPHPRPETDKGALVSVRRFLINAGIHHDEI